MCDTSRAPISRAPASWPQPQIGGMWICDKCSTGNKNGKLFCRSCHTRRASNPVIDTNNLNSSPADRGLRSGTNDNAREAKLTTPGRSISNHTELIEPPTGSMRPLKRDRLKEISEKLAIYRAKHQKSGTELKQRTGEPELSSSVTRARKALLKTLGPCGYDCNRTRVKVCLPSHKVC